MKILFCNITWMKNYIGVTEDDKPINGGKYVKENKDATESYNFHDYDGTCYGYVSNNGNLAIENHFDNVKRTDDYVDDVLVIWMATNEKQETRIVGWYKNARVYRSYQEQIAYTHPNYNLFYNISADAINCYLLPAENRTFPIERAAQSGKGTGIGRSNVWYAESSFARTILIPKVLEYIEGYDGEFKEFAFSVDALIYKARNIKTLGDLDDTFNKGIEFYENGDYDSAFTYFYAASLIKETPQVLYYLGQILYLANRYSRAIEVLTEIEDLVENKIEAAYYILYCYDLKGDRKNTLIYSDKIINLLGDSKDEIEGKLELYELKFVIYFDRQEIINAERIMEEIRANYNTDKSRKLLENMEYDLKNLRMRSHE